MHAHNIQLWILFLVHAITSERSVWMLLIATIILHAFVCVFTPQLKFFPTPIIISPHILLKNFACDIDQLCIALISFVWVALWEDMSEVRLTWNAF